ncbi:MAG: alpha/beta fold hydrolase [Rubrivivax sp.]
MPGRPGRRRRRIALAVAGALLAGPAAGLTLSPCTLPGVEHPAQCGSITRPLDPAAPQGARIDVQVAVLPALARRKHEDAVVFLAGGPGQSAIELAGTAQRLLARLGNRRDLVLVDLRGTGRSAPLRCDEADGARRPLAETLDADRSVEQLHRCRVALQSLPHGDLRRYTTTLAMQDLEAVRQALGVPRLNLVGVSYGTRAALEYLRLYPQAVRRVVLDGVAPADMGLPLSSATDAAAAYDALLAWCAADPACADRHPALAHRWRRLLATLPREVTLVHPLTGADERVRLDADGAESLLRAALYSPVLASALPGAMEEAIAGRWQALVGLASALGGAGRRGSLAQGLHFSVVCSEDASRLDKAAAAAAAGPGASLARLYLRVCADWPRGELPAGYGRVAASPAPVLLLSGGLDPVTPPRHAERVARALGAQARHLVVPQAGHGVASLPCLRDQVFRFIDAERDGEALGVDAACARELPRPGVFVPPLAAGVAR